MSVKLLKNSFRASEENGHLLLNREEQSQEEPASIRRAID